MDQRGHGPPWWPAVAAIVGCLVAGRLLGTWAAPALHDRMLPWSLGRGLGLAGLLSLTALVASGLWLRHPWRRDSRRVPPAAQLRIHATLAGATAALVAGHVVSLALDRYAGVGWTGALVPGRSVYRPLGVGLGTAALYLGLLVGGAAALAGRVGIGRRWLPVHRLSAGTFALVWAHGLLAGSDDAALRGVYVGGGLLIAVLASTRWYARRTSTALEKRP